MEGAGNDQGRKVRLVQREFPTAAQRPASAARGKALWTALAVGTD
jgi:hypothetical protein